jgi:hypothetical protein
MKDRGEDKVLEEAGILQLILTIRGKKVMIDRDLAVLYGVTTKYLNQQVRRNPGRFPEDFMFQLTAIEKNEVVAICNHLRSLRFSSFLPYVFTEHGAVMLASVLNSPEAIKMNVRIVRVFNKMRENFLLNKELETKVVKIEERMDEQEQKVDVLIEYVKDLSEVKAKPRKRIGYKIPGTKNHMVAIGDRFQEHPLNDKV